MDIITFKVGEQRYGLPITQVVEVLRMVAAEPLPDAPRGMIGVIDFRGHIVPLIDLQQTLGLPALTLALNTPFIVAQSEERMIAIAVEAVYDVQTITLTDEGETQGLSTDIRFVSHVVREGAQLTMLLDLAGIIKRFSSTPV